VRRNARFFVFSGKILNDMKNILLLLLICSASFAQDKLLGILPLENGSVVYSDVMRVEGVSQQDLYKRAKRWFVKTYKSAKDVTQYDDVNNEISGKGIFTINWQVTFYGSMPLDVRHAIRFEFKDGRYKYEISQFSTKLSSGAGSESKLEDWSKARPKNTQKVYNEINNRVMDLIVSFRDFIATPPKDDW
jgi:hypothetical protein